LHRYLEADVDLQTTVKWDVLEDYKLDGSSLVELSKRFRSWAKNEGFLQGEQIKEEREARRARAAAGTSTEEDEAYGDLSSEDDDSDIEFHDWQLRRILSCLDHGKTMNTCGAAIQQFCRSSDNQIDGGSVTQYC
jgi:hypothetical protein